MGNPALFPLFYEAIDNRGLIHLSLGKYKKALRDFEQSLQVNPNGKTAFLAKGECLMQLEQLAAAEATFQGGLIHFPEERAAFTKLLERVRALRKKHQAAASAAEAAEALEAAETSEEAVEAVEAMELEAKAEAVTTTVEAETPDLVEATETPQEEAKPEA